MGVLAKNGWAVKQDYAEDRQNGIAKAAERGYGGAQNHLALLYAREDRAFPRTSSKPKEMWFELGETHGDHLGPDITPASPKGHARKPARCPR